MFILSAGLLVLAGPGCAMNDLKNTNRRLKEANDHLVAENNRLEQELAASEKDLTDKNKQIGDLQAGQEKPKTVAVPQDPAPPVARNENIPGLTEDDVHITQVPQGILLRLEERVLFASGKAALSPRGSQILDKVARSLNTRYGGHLIRVEGHTDDVPVRRVKNQYPTNWELSTARACSVVRHLVDKGSVSPRRVYPAGFASYKPVASARSPVAREKNRRVEILILNEKA